MDQSAFRQLVSSQSSSGERGGGNAEHDRERKSKRVFGKSQKRTGTSNGSNKDEIQQLVPRKLGKNETSKEEEEDEEEKSERARLKKLYAENYTDRAAARRSGQEELNEFTEVEKLKEDFEQRLKSAKSESERQQLRQQMTFLGGDSKHTVLVNGLDFALLEQQRAKMNGDDDLENAFNSNTEKRKVEKESSYTNTTSQFKNDKFKPIGSSKPKEEESPDYIWRNGKRMRKKRKDKGNTVKSDVAEVTKDQSKRAKLSKKINKEEEKSNTTTQQSDKEVVEENGKSDSKVPAPSVEDITLSKSIQTASDQKPVEDSEEEDEDIFAGAGRWDGGFVDEASDEDGAV